MEDFSSIDYNNKSIENSKMNETKKSILIHSNSETNFIINTVKEKRKIIRRYLRKRNKIISNLNTTNSKKRKMELKKGDKIKNIIRKNKLELSNCIENKGGKNLKLFGNSRYNQKSPLLFVDDLKKKISSKKMGLIPMPTSKDDESKILKEPKYIYSIQRNLSMTRRFQYNKKEEYLKSLKDNQNINKNNKYYNAIQSWWKKMPQIIEIQKICKGYLVRKKVKPIFQLYKFMQYFERFLINLEMKKVFIEFLAYSINKGRKNIEGLYISKKRNIKSEKFINNIITIQNNFRIYQAKCKKNFLLRKKNGYIINKISFITKKIYKDQNRINNNIVKIQNNIKGILEKKNYVDKSLISNNNGVYYCDKIYLSYKNQKVIKFVKLIRHVLQLLAFKKKLFYKIPSDYNTDDINKVKFIQKYYLKHYYNNIKHFSFHNFKQNNNNNIKNCSFITKEKIEDVKNKFLMIQKAIKMFLNKQNKIKNHINKNNINKNYLITKDNFRFNNCISKIRRFQNYFKKQYRNNMNNIINYRTNTIEDSSYDDYSERDNKTLRQMAYRNRIPKKINQGFYISKLRKATDDNINLLINNNKIILHQEGILITKKRYYNNENQIKRIQKIIKNRKKEDNILKKPLINDNNLYSKNDDTYNEDFLYTKKVNNYNYQSKIIKYNIENKIKLLQNYFLRYYNNKKRLFNIYKKERPKRCLISKYLKKDENIKQINIKFLLLISLFIKKNIQQYVYYLIKQDLKNFEYPFCLNTINRVLKYLNSNEYKGSIVKLLFTNIQNNLNSKNTNNKDLILLLNKEQEEQLRNINIFNNLEKDCLDYIYGFSSFDKKLKNEKFLNIRLNNTKFNNTNIFTITRFIDNEFENFVKGKYCYKCYLDLNICKCGKEDLEDNSLDIGINDDYNPKNSIKFFEYNKEKDKNNIIEGKPKINQSSQIITKNKLIKNDIKGKELIDVSSQKNILMNSRKKFESLRINKEKSKQNILLRDENENNIFIENQF